MQVIVLDVLALMSLEPLIHWDDEQTAIHRLGTVFEPRRLVDALNHEAGEAHRSSILELAIQLERFSRDDGFQRQQGRVALAALLRVGIALALLIARRRERVFLSVVIQSNATVRHFQQLDLQLTAPPNK